MSDYTYDDIRKMQDEAKKRVYEMQQRSKAAAENFRGESKSAQLPETPKSISLPVELPEYKKDYGSNKNITSVFSGFTGNMSTDDAERLLILSLCMLLESEHSDNALILALMYLMA